MQLGFSSIHQRNEKKTKNDQFLNASKNTAAMPNRVESDHTDPKEASDPGLLCMLRPVSPNTSDHYGKAIEGN